MEYLYPTHLPLYHKYVLMAESSNQLLGASDSQAIYSAKLQHNILTKQNLGWFPLKSLHSKMQLFHKSISFPSPACTLGVATLLAISARESKSLETSTQIASKHFLVQQFCYSLYSVYRFLNNVP